MRRTIRTILLVVLAIILGASLGQARELSVEQRVEAQRAIEQVYWNHRIWPKDNPGPKPPLSAVLTDEAIRAKVEDYLKKSNALEKLWQRPISVEQLQAEVDRMAKSTRDPRVLAEIFAALGNDPSIVAETLARQTLADQAIHKTYANDKRIHGALKRRVEAALAACSTGECMKLMGGEYGETTWKLRPSGAALDGERPGGPDVTTERSGRWVESMDANEWKDLLARLDGKPGGGPPLFPTGTLSRVEETDGAFVVSAVLVRGEEEVTTAAEVWRKQPFEGWWSEASANVEPRVVEASGPFTLPALATTPCTAGTGTWTLMSSDVLAFRTNHTAVWTGTEMIVWGGFRVVVPTSYFLNTGGRYNPSTDVWAATSMGLNVPHERRDHLAVWTGTEMIVWGGSRGGDTGGRYNPSSDTWRTTSTTAPCPAEREHPTAVWTGTEMIVWGGRGFGGSGYQNTGGRYSPYTDTWRATSTNEPCPGGRWDHTAVWTGTEMIVWGGDSGGSLQRGGGRYDPIADGWRSTDYSAPCPTARYHHTAVWTGTEMIIWGGNENTGPLPYTNSGGRYNPSTNTWRTTSTGAGVPTPRILHTAVWTGSEMIVWGGDDRDSNDFNVNTGARYVPAALVIDERWTPTSTGDYVPEERLYHTAVWTGKEMIISGGEHGIYNQDLGGSRYCACPEGILVYGDADGDGYGDLAVSAPACYGTIPTGYVADHTDCDDTDPAVHPGVSDATCNFVDDNCNGRADENAPGGCRCAVRNGSLLDGWWPGDGNAIDFSGIGNNGTMMNGATFADGKVGQAFSFDGVDDYVGNIGSIYSYGFIERTGIFTIDAWIRLNDPDARTQQAITANIESSSDRGHIFSWLNTTGQQQLRLATANGVPDVLLIDSTSPNHIITDYHWHHVAAVGDGAHVTFYVDGARYPGSGTMNTSTSGSSTRALNIGSCPYTSPLCQFNGEIDEVQIFFRTLRTSEIRALYTAGGAGMCKCTDADGDGYGTVGGLSCGAGNQQDCNDADPNVHPGAPGFCQNCMPDGTACNNGAGCTQGDICRSGNCFAPVTFAPPVSTPAGSGQNAMVVGDWNRDGHRDVAEVGGYLTILLGDGAGHFASTTTSIYAGTYPVFITAADFNRDGKPDLAMCSGGSNSLTVAIGDGLGAFTRAYSPSLYGANYIAVGDFNGDGNLDLAVTVSATGAVSRAVILIGNGAGGFNPSAVPSIPGAGGLAVAAGDWNEDGKVDLAVTTSDTKNVEIWLGDGTGRFTEPLWSPIGLSGSYPSQLMTGDVNGDGYVDLVVDDSSVIKVLLGDGTGRFSLVSAISSGGYSSIGFALGDVNGDGRLDFVTTNQTNNNLQVGLGTGAGWFTLAATSPFAVGTSPRPVAVGDWNEDGKLDLFVGHIANTATILLNNATSAPNGTPCDDGFSCTINDLCGGLICGGTPNCDDNNPCTDDSCGSAAGCVHTNNTSACDDGNVCTLNDTCRSGNCQAPVSLAQAAWSPATGGSSPNSIASGDWNGDGTLDLAEAGGTGVTILLGDGAGRFAVTGSTITTVGAYPLFIVSGDFNRDGRLDLSVASGGSNSVTILLGNGQGGFVRSNVYTLYEYPISMAVGDYNGDGNLDLAVALEGSSTNSYVSYVAILLGNGAGAFNGSTATRVPAGRDALSVVAGDWNLDSKLDLAVTTGYSYDPKAVRILLGNGLGGFTEASGSPIDLSGYYPTQIAAGDLNGDGKLDLVVNDYGRMLALLGDGGGQFSLTSSFTSGATDGFALGDFNEDGKLDFVATSRSGNTLALGLGNGAGWFTAAPGSPFFAWISPKALAVGDWNMDGKLDLVTGNWTSPGVVTIFLNNATSAPNGTPCDDGFSCTINDVCGGLICSGTPNCDDNNPCTDDSCDPVTGCAHTNNTSACDDATVCNGHEVCGGGTCNGGPAPSCNDNNSCTDDSCNPATGCVFISSTAACDDGNSCSVNDTCSGGVCSGTCYCTESGGGVAGWWPGEGNANDISGGGRNGTPTNGATFASGKVGQAFSLDGVNDFVQVPGYLNTAPVNEVTVTFWQKVASAKVQSTFSQATFVAGAVFNAHVPYNNGTVYWDFGDISTGGRLSYTPPVSLVGTWQHFALVASQSGNYMRIFRNGVLEAAKAGMTPLVRANVDLAIGGAPGLSFGGQIDEFAIYSRALSASEIKAQYDAGAQGVCKQCADPDGDGYGAAGDTCRNGTAVDCAATNAAVWAVPSDPTGVTYTKVSPPGTVRWAWNPATGGAAGGVFYDVRQDGGGQPSTCVLSNGVATEVTESAIPPVGGMLFYRVRAENACGVSSASQPDCP